MGTGRGADFLQLSRASAPVRGLTSWLAGAVRAAIMDGRLPAGTSLPATRLLAGDLGISRGVVVEAYQRLADEGLVSGRPGTGTRVSGLPPRSVRPSKNPPPPGRAGATVLPQPWRARAELDLSPGVPDLSGFPRAAWLRAERSVLDQASVAELGYGDPSGSQWLRRELAGWLARTRGLRAAADDIIVVSGVAQALALLAQCLHARGITRIAVEDPGSLGSRDQLTHWGLATVPVPVDEQGLTVGNLADRDLRAALLTPAHQFPTGVVLAPRRRRELLDWAVAADAVIIEDDYDAEYRYDRAPVPALQAAAPGHVAYAGTTSKTLAPGMRLGWLVPPARWMRSATSVSSTARSGKVMSRCSPAGTPCTRAAGRCDRSAPSRASRRLRCRWRTPRMWCSSSPVAIRRASTSCGNTGLPRSAACLAATRSASSRAGGTSQPRRMPGASVLDVVPA